MSKNNVKLCSPATHTYVEKWDGEFGIDGQAIPYLQCEICRKVLFYDWELPNGADNLAEYMRCRSEYQSEHIVPGGGGGGSSTPQANEDAPKAAGNEDWAVEARAVKRPCAVCGKSQSHKKVWSKFGKQVICLSCGISFEFDKAGNVRRYNSRPIAAELSGAIFERFPTLTGSAPATQPDTDDDVDAVPEIDLSDEALAKLPVFDPETLTMTPPPPATSDETAGCNRLGTQAVGTVD